MTTVIIVFGTLMFVVLLALIAIILKVTGVLGGAENMVAQTQPVAQQPAAATRSPEAVNLFQKALNAYNGKRFQEASALLDATLTISPDYAEAAALKDKLAVDAKAEELLAAANKAIAAKRYEEANRLLSEVPEQAMRYDEVRQLKARIQSSFIDDLYERGVKALEANDIGRAKEVANKIGSIDPNAPQLGELRDQIAAGEERKEEKREAAAREVAASPAPKAVAKAESRPKARKEEPKSAPKAEAPKAAPAPAPTAAATPRELYSQASKQVMANDFGNAIKTFNTCIQTDSKFCQCYRGLGIAYAKYRQPQNAVKNYKRYLSCNPNAPDAAQVTKIIQQYDSN